ncbi:MAG: hypothetical protein IKG56_01745 [Clostridia bacterium]|nr:hypothetical protein [Clostridia bacterium]
MKNNLPQEYNNGFLYKIKSFFKNLFHMNKEIKNDDTSTNQTNIEINEDNKAFVNELKVDNNVSTNTSISDEEKEDTIFKRIEENPDLLNDLSIEKLAEIERIYDKKISELDANINKISSQNV